jgi:hypothetical protein
MISKLNSLATSDPTTFKTLTAQIASQLTTAAANTSGPQADFLTQLAQQFTDASQTGDASKLQPSGHHHHRHHASAAYSAQNSTGTSTGTTTGTSTAANGSTSASSTPSGQATAGPSAALQAVFNQIFQEVAQAS